MKLSSIAGGVVDPRKEGYPVFCLFGGDLNSFSQVKVIGSDFQNIGSPYAAGVNTTMSYGHGMLKDPMFAYNGADAAGSMNSNLSSQGYSSWQEWLQSLHQSDQYPVSAYGSTSPSGYQSFHNFVDGSSNTKLTRGYLLINQVMPEGMRPRRFFGMTGNSFYEFAGLTQMTNPIDTFALNTKVISRNTSTYATGNGSAGYNERTQTLVTLHSTGNSASVIATKFVNPSVNLNTCNSLNDFFATATVTEYTLTMQTNGADSYTDKVVVVGDNGWVGVSYREGNSMYATAYDLSGGNATAINFTTQNMTTSYGVSQGVYYYTKMNTTWDSNWAMAYTPYYYYGCGCFGYVFSTQDPRRSFRIQNTNTASGGMLVPYGKSGLRYMCGVNTDSQSVSIISWDFKNTDVGYSSGANTTYIHSNAAGAQSVANDGLLNSSVNPYSGITGFYYSTCYPNFQTVNYWPLNGKISYEGGSL